MNNLSSYFGLVVAKIRASDKDLPLKSEPESMLARMFSEENKNILMPCQMENDTYLIDRYVQILSPDI